jgi:Cyanobacterial and plant NDH-1 subunit O
MAETPSAPPAAAAAATSAPAAAPIKKGSLVKVNRVAYRGSLEAGASDHDAPDYLFEGPGEVLAIRDDYAQLRFRRPVPDIWLRLDQLETF